MCARKPRLDIIAGGHNVSAAGTHPKQGGGGRNSLQYPARKKVAGLFTEDYGL